MSFLSQFIGLKATGAVNGLKSAIVAFDPETATEAQIAVIVETLAKTNSRLAELQGNLEGAKKSLDADNEAIHQHIDAASALSVQGKDDKAAILLDEVENKLNTKLAQDKQEYDDIHLTMAEFEKSRAEMTEKLRTARTRMDAAKRDLARAQLDNERASAKVEQAQRGAGLLKSVSDLDVAGDAMTKAAAKARADAQAKRLQAESLGSLASPAASADPDIAAALAASRNGAPAPAQSVAERLAALKAKAA